MKHFRRRDKASANAAKGRGEAGPERSGNSRNAAKAGPAIHEEGGHRCKTCNMVPVPTPHSKCAQCRALDGV